MPRWNCCAIRSCSGQPVVIGGGRRHQPQLQADGSRRFSQLRDYTGRGVITTATYAARDLGVFSAMGLMKAAQRAPDAVLLPVDFDEYRRYSRLFKAAVAEVTPLIEDRGIDEIYIDLSDVPGVHDTLAHDPLRRRARGGAGDPQQRQARHRPELLDRRDAEQAAVEDRLRAGQARRADDPDARRPAHAHLAAAGAAHQRHRPEGRREAGGAWASRTIGELAAQPRDGADRALRQELRRLAASTPRTAATSGRW